MAKMLNIRTGAVSSKEATQTAKFEQIAPEELELESPRLIHELFHDPKLTQQLCDATIVAAKSAIASNTTYYEDLIAADDDITQPGSALTNAITDLNEGKLPKGENFMLYGIQLLYADTVTTAIGTADWGLIPNAMRNGTFSLEQDGRVIVPDISMEVFFTPEYVAAVGTTVSGAGYAVTTKEFGSGLFLLDEPKILRPNAKIDVVMRFGGAITTSGDDDAIKIVMHGIKNYRV